MRINQLPTPPNEWLFEQTFVPQEDGTIVEHRDNWCTQHLGIIPDGTPPSDWYKYLYMECTSEEKEAWEEEQRKKEEEEQEVEPNGLLGVEPLDSELLPNNGVTDVDA